MNIPLRKIGNSRGIIIPLPIIQQLQLEHEVELLVQDGVLHLKPVHSLRNGWFDHYDPSQEVEPLAPMKTLDSEEEDWQW